MTYTPLAMVQANGQQFKLLEARLARLRAESSAADRAKKKWESDCAEARRAVQLEEAAAIKAPGLSPAEKAEATRLRQEQVQQQAAPPTSPECRNPPHALVQLKRDRADLLCVYELGRVEGREDGEAIAALVGSKMMAVVTSTEAEKEQLIRDQRRKGLMIVALQNFACGHPGRHPALAPPGARLAIELVRPVNQAYQCVWQDLLRDALVFDSEDHLAHYKAQHGYGRVLAARRRSGGWRVVRSKWETSGETAPVLAIPALIPLAETLQFKAAAQRHWQLCQADTLAEGCRVRHQQALERLATLEANRPPAHRDFGREILECQQELNGLTRLQDKTSAPAPARLTPGTTRKRRADSDAGTDGSDGGPAASVGRSRR
uniref:SMC hinge domain-containing protein n=1 Tax=Cryptomonas curvata TaxID=233186 RepID=A0A7S0MXD9_9CRYP